MKYVMLALCSVAIVSDCHRRTGRSCAGSHVRASLPEQGRVDLRLLFRLSSTSGAGSRSLRGAGVLIAQGALSCHRQSHRKTWSVTEEPFLEGCCYRASNGCWTSKKREKVGLRLPPGLRLPRWSRRMTAGFPLDLTRLAVRQAALWHEVSADVAEE